MGKEDNDIANIFFNIPCYNHIIGLENDINFNKFEYDITMFIS